MKALVCGNAPCFIKEIEGKDLYDFFIVRMNGFISTPELKRRHAWSSWPDPTHRLKHDRCEPMYDVKQYAYDTKELWLVHPGFLPLALRKLKRKPNYTLSYPALKEINNGVGSAPNMGMLMIQACLAQPRFTEIYVVGFDFYESENDYYFCEGKFDHPVHNQLDNKNWFLKQLEKQRIKLL